MSVMKTAKEKAKPVAVLISDVHYSLSTLTLADASMRQAIATANELLVTLAVAGDLHDTKANLRGECVNAMIETFKLCERPPAIIIGNHDKINEKSSDHSLNFLAPYAMVIEKPTYLHPVGYLIPYQHDRSAFLAALENAANKTVIAHQGLQESLFGDYIQDKTAINPSDVPPLRIYSGHYHTRQQIALPSGGSWDYIGNPYTLTYGEANDPPKGYQVLFSDGSAEFMPTNLRKHTVINITTEGSWPKPNTGDLTWVKVSGTKEQLQSFDKTPWLGCRIDLIPIDTTTQSPEAYLNLSQDLLLDHLIDSLSSTSEERKERLKTLWKELK